LEQQQREAKREFEQQRLEAEQKFEQQRLEAKREFEQQRLEAEREFERQQRESERQQLEVVGPWRKRRKIFLDAKAAVDLAGGYQISPAHNLPIALAEHVLEFIFNDPKTLFSWVQTCHRNRTLCLDKLTALKVFWEQLKGLGRARKEVFRVKLSGLKRLYLRANGLGAKAALGPEGAVALAAVLPQLTGLETLYLNENYIGDAGAAALAPALAQLTRLTELKLTWNAIGDAGAASLATVLPQMTGLKSFFLGFNKFGDEGAAALAAVLPQLAGLETLALRYSETGPKGAAALAAVLPQLTGLERLDLGGNEIGPETKATFRAAWEKAGKDASKLKV
jgi:hypothetical protein